MEPSFEWNVEIYLFQNPLALGQCIPPPRHMLSVSRYYIKDKKLIQKVLRRFTNIINNMEGKTYQERLRCLKPWTLEERRNRQGLIEVLYVMGCQGLS